MLTDELEMPEKLKNKIKCRKISKKKTLMEIFLKKKMPKNYSMMKNQKLKMKKKDGDAFNQNDF